MAINWLSWNFHPVIWKSTDDQFSCSLLFEQWLDLCERALKHRLTRAMLFFVVFDLVIIVCSITMGEISENNHHDLLEHKTTSSSYLLCPSNRVKFKDVRFTIIEDLGKPAIRHIWGAGTSELSAFWLQKWPQRLIDCQCWQLIA